VKVVGSLDELALDLVDSQTDDGRGPVTHGRRVCTLILPLT